MKNKNKLPPINIFFLPKIHPGYLRISKELSSPRHQILKLKVLTVPTMFASRIGLWCNPVKMMHTSSQKPRPYKLIKLSPCVALPQRTYVNANYRAVSSALNRVKNQSQLLKSTHSSGLIFQVSLFVCGYLEITGETVSGNTARILRKLFYTRRIKDKKKITAL